jgi:hypothetical protein
VMAVAKDNHQQQPWLKHHCLLKRLPWKKQKCH